MLSWLKALTLTEFIGLLTIANLIMYGLSWMMVAMLQRMNRSKLMNQSLVQVKPRDYLLSSLIVVINVVVGVPGWWLWQAGHITLVDQSWRLAFGHAVLFIIIIDFTMYCLHRLMHCGLLYRLVHERHHQHTDLNGVSSMLCTPLRQ